METLTDESV